MVQFAVHVDISIKESVMIRLIKANHDAIVIVPASQVGPDTVVETGPFSPVIFIYSDEDSVTDVIKTIYEQRRLDKQQASELSRSYKMYN